MSISILDTDIYNARRDIINQILPDIKYQVQFDIPTQARGWKVSMNKYQQPNTGNAILDRVYRMGLMSQDPNLSEPEQKRLERFQREVKILAGAGSRALTNQDIINAVNKQPNLLDRYSMGQIGFRGIDSSDQLVQMPEVSGVLPIIQALKTLQRDRLVEAVTDSRYAGKVVTKDMEGLNEYERAVKLVENRKKYRTYLRSSDYNKLETVWRMGQVNITPDKELMIYAADHARSLYRYIKYTFTDNNSDVKKMLDILEKVQHSKSYQLSKRYLAAVASGNLQVLQIRKFVDRLYKDKKNRLKSTKEITRGKDDRAGYADMSITDDKNQDSIFKQALASYLQTLQQYIQEEVQG